MIKKPYCNKKIKEFVIKLSKIRYLTINISKSRWLLGIHKFTWCMNKNIEWFVYFGCLMFSLNNYGPLIYDKKTNQS